MIEEIVLITGIDIPFVLAQTSIHQPTIKEIAYIGEKNFFMGCELLTFSKETLPTEDKVDLKDYTNFDIIMSILNENRDSSLKKSALAARFVLALLFPTCEIFVYEDQIILEELEKKNDSNKPIRHIISNSNYTSFARIVTQMFDLEAEKQEYKPKGKMASKIADKLRRGNQKIAEAKNELTDASIFSRYVSVLAVGEKKSINSLVGYTVYQLFNEYQRFLLKNQYDFFVKAKLAGSKDIKQPKDWTGDLKKEEEE